MENNVYWLFVLTGEADSIVTNVFSLPLNVFRKSAICPPSEDLLALAKATLNLPRRSFIEAHLSHCEFCRAELQLLEKHRPQPEVVSATEIPMNLKQLAEYILQKYGIAANGLSPN